MSNPVDRVAEAAQTVKLLKVLLAVLAFPFYVLGLVAGAAVVALMWIVAAVQVGFCDVRKRSADPEPT